MRPNSEARYFRTNYTHEPIIAGICNHSCKASCNAGLSLDLLDLRDVEAPPVEDLVATADDDSGAGVGCRMIRCSHEPYGRRIIGCLGDLGWNFEEHFRGGFGHV